MNFALGIDLGGSSVKAVAVTPEGIRLSQTNVPFDTNAEFDWARQIQRIIEDVQAQLGSRVSAVGISAPGLAASDGRSIARMPGRLSGLEGFDWTEFFNAERGRRSAEQSSAGADVDDTAHAPRFAFVPVLNDAHAALLGEAWLGAARGFKNVFMLTLGTGVGGAAIVDGKLLRGRLGRAGHLGHICLDMEGPRDVCNMPGSLEALVGNYRIEERTRGHFKTTHELVEAHVHGDEHATEIWLKSVRALGYGIASLINVLDPEAVIIGGGIARSGAALFEPLERYVRNAEWDVGVEPVKILPAEMGEFAGAYGAAWNAFQSSGINTRSSQ